jgi:hypothetical protein
MPLTVADVLKHDYRKREMKKKLYIELYERASSKIKQMGEIGKHETWVKVSGFTMGYPAYDLDAAARWVERQLKNGGFTTHLYQNGEIFVSWKIPSKEKSTKKVAKKVAPKTSTENTLESLMNLKKTADNYRSLK